MSVTDGFSSSAKETWDSFKDDIMGFDSFQVALLTEACRCQTRLDALNESIASVGVMVEGSQGQPVVNPALTEVRGQEAIFARLIASMRLPDAAGKRPKRSGGARAPYQSGDKPRKVMESALEKAKRAAG